MGGPFASPEAIDIPNKGLTLKEFSLSGANSFFLELILRWETKIAVASRERLPIYFIAKCIVNQVKQLTDFDRKICQMEEFKRM